MASTFNNILAAVRRFLSAEEVPRWFGLSIVLIYLVGLGTVAHFGIMEARREGAAHFQRSSAYAARLLVHRLGLIDSGTVGTDLSSPEAAGRLQRVLREFATGIEVRTLRVIDQQRRVVASIHAGEVGTIAADPLGDSSGPVEENPFELSPLPAAGSRDARSFIRVRIPWEAGMYFVEAELPSEPTRSASLADQARTLAVILVVLGALFVVYRCLREQLRGVSCIANRLSAHGQRLAEELDALRIAETLDHVTAAWNSLIDLTQDLLEAVKQAEANAELTQALKRRSGSALADALSAIPEGLIYIIDEERIEYANNTARRMLGLSSENSIPAALSECQAEGIGRRVIEVVRGALRSDGTYESRTELLHDDGAETAAGQAATDATAPRDSQGTSSSRRNCGSCYRIQITPLSRAAGRGNPDASRDRHGECLITIRDVSQQVRAERARDEFITQLTHELRTPLTNIRAYAETLSSGMFEDPKIITECYNVITKETRRLSRLIEDILSISQLEIGTIELHTDSLDLSTLLNDAVRDVRGLAEERKIDLQLALPPKMEPVEADRDKLAVVLNNLLGNAIKYTPPGGNVVVGCQYTPGEVVITVKDDGRGIKTTDQARVFEKFQRGSDPEVQKEPGTGVGLYTAREIVRRHHGEIDLISEHGKGSTFLVRLPRKASRTNLSGREAHAGPVPVGA